MIFLQLCLGDAYFPRANFWKYEARNQKQEATSKPAGLPAAGDEMMCVLKSAGSLGSLDLRFCASLRLNDQEKQHLEPGTHKPAGWQASRSWQ